MTWWPRRLGARGAAVPLTAGAAALHAPANGQRFSDDLDYFQDSVERVVTAFSRRTASVMRIVVAMQGIEPRT
jgi:hypothetical protein